jgi:hypothetical protein
VLTIWETARAGKKKRGSGKQIARRALERQVRKRVLAVMNLLGRMGYTKEMAATRLGLSVRTLKEWRTNWKKDRMKLHLRGRPLAELRKDLKDRVVGMIDYFGPHVGVATLRSIFPERPRGEIQEVLRQYRRVYVRKNSILVGELRWLRPGAVWTTDFGYPPRPIDGEFNFTLMVRDLASGKNLLWLPVVRRDAGAARDAVRALCIEHGPPLAMKEDNDGAFRGSAFEGELGEWGVVMLPSPVEMPWYNGSCEAGIGSLKTYTHHEAARHGRPGEWTCDDVETARFKANGNARPFGSRGPSSDEAWRKRRSLTEEEREAFRMAVARNVDEIRREKGDAIERRGWQERAGIERQAVVRALVKLGYLEVRRRRISPPINSQKRARIS